MVKPDRAGGGAAEFMEAFSAFGQHHGLPKSVARVLAYLIVCRPAHQSAEAIQHGLQLSAGSVSTATTMLTRMKLVERVRLPGDRRHYYQIVPDGFTNAVLQRLRGQNVALEIARKGLQADPANSRLRALHDLYALMDKETAPLIQMLEKHAKQA